MTIRRSRTCTAPISTHATRCARPETPMYLDALLPDMPLHAGRRADARRPLSLHLHPVGLSGVDPAGPARRAQPSQRRVPLGDAVLLPRQGGGQGAHREIPKAVVVQAQGPLDPDQGGGRANRRRRSSTTPRRTRRPTPTPRCRSSAMTSSSFGYLTTTVTVWDHDLEAGAPKEPAGQRGHSVARLHRARRDAQFDARVAREPAGPRLRERPAAARQLHEPHALDAALVACGPATRSIGTSRACAASARRTFIAAPRARRPFACISRSATSATRSSSARRAPASRRCSACWRSGG